MNSGYLSLIFLCITLILFGSGWKEIYLKSSSHKGILLFFIGWLTLSRLTVTFQGLQINLIFVGLCGLCVGILYLTKGFVQKLHLLSIGLLLGSLHFLLEQILEMDPILIVLGNPKLDTCFMLAVIVTLLQRNELEQIACLSIGLLLGEVFQTVVHQTSTPRRIGGTDFQDEWWLAVFTARTLTIMLLMFYNGCKGLIRHWMERRGGWRK